MNKADDRAFARTFSAILIGLIIFTAVIIVLARSLTSHPDPSTNPSKLVLTEKRIGPIAAVRVGAAGQEEIAAAQQVQVAAAPAADVAVDGSQVYNSVCTACHAAGVAGAPMIGSDMLAQRLADKGVDGLVGSVINGLGVMPPRGGRPDLTDEQLRAAVEFMLQ